MSCSASASDKAGASMARPGASTKLPLSVMLLIGGWLATLAGGLVLLAAYSNAPGADMPALRSWPDNAAFCRHDSLPTAVLFIHPKCPCSRASLRELERVQGHNQSKVALTVACYCPTDEPDSWIDTDLRQFAERLQPERIFLDRGGVEAKRFGVTTSGHALFFDEEGACLFSGGITAARGHEGDNIGATAMRNAICGRNIHVTETPVFGCSLVRAIVN